MSWILEIIIIIFNIFLDYYRYLDQLPQLISWILKLIII